MIALGHFGGAAMAILMSASSPNLLYPVGFEQAVVGNNAVVCQHSEFCGNSPFDRVGTSGLIDAKETCTETSAWGCGTVGPVIVCGKFSTKTCTKDTKQEQWDSLVTHLMTNQPCRETDCGSEDFPPRNPPPYFSVVDALEAGQSVYVEGYSIIDPVFGGGFDVAPYLGAMGGY
jgi:hypothetical protein